MKELRVAEEFYHWRDDRTNRLVDQRDYHQFHVRVVAGVSTVQSYTGQVQLLTVANMLARWCRTIELDFVDTPLVNQLQFFPGMTLHQRIDMEMGAADPYGTFVFQRERSDGVHYTLKIGSTPINEPIDFTIDSDGWLVYAGRGNCLFSLLHPQNNPVGPTLAACIGVADAFKIATAQPKTSVVQHIIFSAFDLRVPPSPSVSPPLLPKLLSLGNIQMIGVGSVGSAVTYLLRMLSVDASLSFIDHDPVKIENLNRSPLFGYTDVGHYKVDVAQRYLQSHIPAKAFVGTYSDFLRQNGRLASEVDLILSLANEFSVRSDIEHNFPPLQVYGTTFDWGINYHHHIPLVDDCSLCRFPEKDIQASMICSTTKIEITQEEQIDAALPFASMGAAALIIAGLIRLQFPNYVNTPNFACIDFKGDLNHLLSYQRKAHSECSCTTRSKSVHKRLIDKTRFRLLSLDEGAIHV